MSPGQRVDIFLDKARQEMPKSYQGGRLDQAVLKEKISIFLRWLQISDNAGFSDPVISFGRR